MEVKLIFYLKGFGGHSYDALKGSLAPIGARRHLPARSSVKTNQLQRLLNNIPIVQYHENLIPTPNRKIFESWNQLKTTFKFFI